MATKIFRMIGFGAGVLGMLFIGLGGVEPSISVGHSWRKQNTFSNQDVDELLARYIPTQNLLTARYMVACLGGEADVKAYRALLKKLAHPYANIDRLTDEEVNTICYFLGQLIV